MRCHFRSAQRGSELKSCVCVCTCVKLGLSLLLHSIYPDPAEGVDGLHLIQLRPATRRKIQVKQSIISII